MSRFRFRGAHIALAVIVSVLPQLPTLAACATEDSNGCHWDASTQGNGQGRSFDVDQFGNVTYTD